MKKDIGVHLEFSRMAGLSGAVCLTTEDETGQFSHPLLFEVGPFDTGLDVALWVRNCLVDAGVVTPT